VTDRPELTARELITTTRSVRRRLDRSRPVAVATVLECLDDALQAPNGGDAESWRWVVVTDPERRQRIGDLYRRANGPFTSELADRARHGDTGAARRLASTEILTEHLGEVPVHVVASFAPLPWFDGSAYSLASAYASVLPAVWNLQLALRLRGLASCIVTAHLRFADEVAEIIDLDRSFQQVALIPVGHLIGSSLGRAPRRPLDEVVHVDSWATPG
jgi:nitroreductase